MSLVSFCRIRSDTANSMKQAIAEALQLIDYSFNDETKDIVIKPNLCYYWDRSTGQTTDVRFVASLVDLIREKVASDPNISIVEADASAMKCKYAFKMLGYDELARKYGVRLVNLSEDRNDRIGISVAGRRLSFRVPQTIRRADLKINIPKIKYTPRNTKITCALKNLFGCNPYPKKFRYHPSLDEVIVALNKLMPFDLCLVDGNIVSGSQPRRLGLVMAGKDPVAVDVAAARIAGINPNRLTYLKLAVKEGIGKMSFSPRGTQLDYFAERYPRETAKERLVAAAYRLVLLAGLDRKLGLE